METAIYPQTRSKPHLRVQDGILSIGVKLDGIWHLWLQTNWRRQLAWADALLVAKEQTVHWPRYTPRAMNAQQVRNNESQG